MGERLRGQAGGVRVRFPQERAAVKTHACTPPGGQARLTACVPTRAPTMNPATRRCPGADPVQFAVHVGRSITKHDENQAKAGLAGAVCACPHHGRLHGGLESEAAEQGQLQVSPALAECWTQNKPSLSQRDR